MGLRRPRRHIAAQFRGQMGRKDRAVHQCPTTMTATTHDPCCSSARPAARSDSSVRPAAHSDGGSQQSAHHRPEVVTGTLEPKYSAAHPFWAQGCQQGVARGRPHAPRHPGQRAKDPRLPHRRGHADRSGRQCRSQVAAGRDPSPTFGVIRERSADQFHHPNQGVADPVDHAEGRGGCAQCPGEKCRQYRRRYLVARIGEKLVAPTAPTPRVSQRRSAESVVILAT